MSRRDFRLIEYDELYSFPDNGLDGVVSEVRHAGVAEAEAVDEVLEPNPARGRVGVKTTVGMTGLSVYNVQGALFERQEARGVQAEIDVTGWPKGVYYVTVSTPTGVAQRRLVVQ